MVADAVAKTEEEPKSPNGTSQINSVLLGATISKKHHQFIAVTKSSMKVQHK